jgi:hypothetical protein
MTEDNLQRLDTALRLLADVTQELHSLRALMTQPAPSNRPAIPPARLGANARILVRIWRDMVKFTGSATTADVVEAAWPQYPRGDENTRDTRKVNAQRDLRGMILKGVFTEEAEGRIQLSSRWYLQENADV